uniref:Autophagy related 13 n=1 Tax=Ovis aries TaxID=9940 RepID=A0AC11DI71_SHEEP
VYGSEYLNLRLDLFLYESQSHRVQLSFCHTVQVIVQARLGEKICTRSSSSPTGSDWFNLAIKDIPEVTHEAKKALAGQLPAVGRSMCVEISLKTSEVRLWPEQGLSSAPKALYTLVPTQPCSYAFPL